MKVLVIAEDPRLDQFMLKPLIAAALKHCGKPNARVVVCQDGNLRGDATVIDKDRMLAVIDDYPVYDAYILCVGRDCNETRLVALQALQKAVREARPNKTFVAACGLGEEAAKNYANRIRAMCPEIQVCELI